MVEVQNPPMVLASADRVRRSTRSGADQSDARGAPVVHTRRPQAGTGQALTTPERTWIYEWDLASKEDLAAIQDAYRSLPHTPFRLLRESSDNPFSPSWQAAAEVVVFDGPPTWRAVAGGQHFQVTVQVARARSYS